MTITTVPPVALTPEEERAAYIKGLRALADVLEGHPEVPLPYTGTGSPITISFLSAVGPRSAMAAAARAFPCDWRKNPWESGGTAYFDLLGNLHGLQVKLNAFRDAVCERVVTGTREVTEKVKDPEALAAVPEIEITKTVEEVEWVCGSILAPAASEEGKAAA